VGLQVSFDFYGDVQVNREILRVGERGHNLVPLWDEIHESLMELEEKQFGTQGRHASGGWRPLAESTVLRKASAGLDPRILHATLALRKSLTVRSDPNMLIIMESDFFQFSSKLGYFPFHQLGSRDGEHPPQRRVIEFTKTARANVMKSVQRYVTTGEARKP